MKALILTLILLFSTSVIAEHEVVLPPAEFQQFIEENINFGLEADSIIFRQYVEMVYEHGTPIQNMGIAIQFAHCSIMWRTVLKSMPGSATLSHKQVESGIWRAIVTSQLHVEQAQGVPERTETYMIPMLLVLDLLGGTGKTAVTAANIYTCTALDVTTFNSLREQGQSPFAPEDWVLEPIPPLPEDAFDEETPESGSIGS